MELFYVENTKYIAKCPECSEIVKFEINYENFYISVECKNGHNKNNLPYEEFEQNYIKPSQIYTCNCYNCFKLINDENINYKCQNCDKLFCADCINVHMQKTKHNSKTRFYHQYQLCQKHNQKYSLFCEVCKLNICNKCKINHKNHSFKSILEIFPNKAKQHSIGTIIEEFDNKINKVTSIILNYKNEIDKRYRKINGFLLFLKNINRNLLNNFNYNYYDYYNFENFNYLYDSINKEHIFNTERYKDYLFMKEIEKNFEEKEVLNKSIDSEDLKKKTESGLDIDYIQNLGKLQYLKENIFFDYERNLIKFFEFKNFSFKLIFFYNLKKFRINNVQAAKYSNTILLNFELKKNIKFLEYDLSKKIIKLSKKEVKDQRIGYPKHFYKCLDNKNGNILTHDNNGIIIWKSDNKNNYNKIKTINIASQSLYDINESLFCFQDNDYNIYFYDSINYECNQIISYNKKINLIGTINNEQIVFNNSYSNIIFVVDIKNLEIVQIIENDKYFANIKIKENNLLAFTMEKCNEIKIIKKIFNLKEKCFTGTEIIEKPLKLNNILNILITDYDYVVILNYKNMVLLKI